ncbi:aldose 1-epimerase family protein [Cellulomonas cellasea]|uniref:Aldose 1-epimerase n=1 Tax=Cellulomonas cellasea TaxID=43670 RepID=A0A7W4UF09_9CELL|nr:aldose 1-epimerase family protein [Cellulomonas cellasea]MBB2922966.1 aldose 1-epimerase [Cellulomonas cellasea]
MNIPAPSGRQYHLARGDQHATIAEVGASIREYSVGGRDVALPFEKDQIAPAYSGAVLAPWPNRLTDGQYTFDGVEHQVPVNEPGRMTALHGLVSHARFTPSSPVSDTSVTLEHEIVPTLGYPFPVRVRATYALTDEGLEVLVTATNLGQHAAPYGVGFHPWLSPGDAAVDDCTIQVDAATRVLVDDRLLPTGTAPLGPDDDMRTPRPLAGFALDDAFVDVVRDDDGLAWIKLASPDGQTSAVWMDDTMDTWQVCTGNDIPGIMRRGVACEPMSCIADAFRTGERLVRLEPGASHTVRWGMRLL